jgi:hypothetical protein
MITQFNNEEGIPIQVEAEHVEKLCPHLIPGYINLGIGNLLIAVEGSLKSVYEALLGAGAGFIGFHDDFPADEIGRAFDEDLSSPLGVDKNPSPLSELDLVENASIPAPEDGFPPNNMHFNTGAVVGHAPALPADLVLPPEVPPATVGNND